MLFVKINFQIRLESVYLARRRGTKTAREGTASGGGERSCSPQQGFLGRGAGHSSSAAGHSSRARFAPRFVAAALSTVLSPNPFLWARQRLHLHLPPAPRAAAMQGWAPAPALIGAHQCDCCCGMLYSSKSLLKFSCGNAEQPCIAKWMESHWGKTDRLW